MITNTDFFFRDSFPDGSLSGYRENNNNYYSTYPNQFIIGTNNIASGAYASSLGGRNVKAFHSGSMVLGDGNINRLKTSDKVNSLTIDFENGITINNKTTINEDTEIYGETTIHDALSVNSDISSSNNLSVQGNLYVYGDIGYFATAINVPEIAGNTYLGDDIIINIVYSSTITDRFYPQESLIDFQNKNLSLFANQYIIINSNYIPTSPTSAGVSGAVVFDDNYLYRHNGKKWTRTAMSTW